MRKNSLSKRLSNDQHASPIEIPQLSGAASNVNKQIIERYVTQPVGYEYSFQPLDTKLAFNFGSFVYLMKFF